MTNKVENKLKQQPKRWIINLVFAIAMILALIYSFSGSAINWTRLETVGIQLRIMLRSFSEINWEFLGGYGAYDFDEGIVYLAIQTLAIAFTGTLLGSILAIPFAFLASKTIIGNKISKIGISLITFIRVFPEIILVLVIVKGFGMTPLACMITIGLHSIGMLGKMFSEVIDNMDKGPIESLDAVGANTWQKIRYGIVPQIVPDLSSISLYRLDINVRSASVLGIVGTTAGGFGAVLSLAALFVDWRTLAAVLIVIVVLVLTVDAISSYLRRKLV